MFQEQMVLPRYQKGFCSSLEDVFRGACCRDVAHVCVDPQRRYVSTERDVQAVAHIGKTLVPMFREMGIPNYWVYVAAVKYKQGRSWSYDYEFLPPEESCGGFCDGIEPEDGEAIVPKVDVSAFGNTPLGDMLEDDKKKILLVTGFTFWACVAHSIYAARREHGFKTVLLSDATDFDPTAGEVLTRFNEIGAVVASSNDVVPILRDLRP